MSARRDRTRIFAARALVAIGVAIWGLSIPVAVLGRPVPPREILRAAFILGVCPLVLGMTLLAVRVPSGRRRNYSRSQRGLGQMLLSDEQPPLEDRIATPPPSWKNAALGTAIVALLVLLAVVILASLAFGQVRYKDYSTYRCFLAGVDPRDKK